MRYVILGEYEQSLYEQPGLQAFTQLVDEKILTVAYQADNTTIYQVDAAALQALVAQTQAVNGVPPRATLQRSYYGCWPVWHGGGWGFVRSALFGALADKGTALSKTLGLLSGYMLWLLRYFLGYSSLDGGGIAFTVLLVAGLGIILQLRQPATARAWQWVREHWQYVVTVEVLFAVIFIGLAYIRLNPGCPAPKSRWNSLFECDFAGRKLPPLDPWLSGYSISYYYFGYLLMAMLITA
ncbi:MAG: hypothetical protein IPO07_28025 [Haliscomenobacter sp.]|nr:DUF2298 domain-containing protein [Haliscomenobacter sp.]MBK9492208.1 hypothetical protein [Haliscomenobacter sp.]